MDGFRRLFRDSAALTGVLEGLSGRRIVLDGLFNEIGGHTEQPPLETMSQLGLSSL